MPYRPVQHQISEKAVAKVREILASIGAAVEEIRRDYGEDLLVQTALNDKMDAARLWVQVKGVHSAPSMSAPGGRTQIRVRADLALRWARTADLLVLILWDVQNNIGWYSIPSFTELHAELVKKERSSISLQINAENLFNPESAQTVVWYARLQHLTNFVRNFRRFQEEEDIPFGAGSWADEAVIAAVIDMMIDLGMADPYGSRQTLIINAEFRTPSSKNSNHE